MSTSTKTQKLLRVSGEEGRLNDYQIKQVSKRSLATTGPLPASPVGTPTRSDPCIVSSHCRRMLNSLGSHGAIAGTTAAAGTVSSGSAGAGEWLDGERVGGTMTGIKLVGDRAINRLAVHIAWRYGVVSGDDVARVEGDEWRRSIRRVRDLRHRERMGHPLKIGPWKMLAP